MPTVFGEKLVMRLLDKGGAVKDIKRLGFDQRQMEDFVAAAEAPHGLIFLTGPTGSGKTTTLYAVLQHVYTPEMNFMTAEDPVEFKLGGISQCQMRANIGLTFASALRAFLRQDPDVILVGEIRDAETAEIAIQASLTGHLVFSTLHTNDATSALSRLIDIGVKPFLVSSAIQAVMAQRLIRVACPECKTPYEPEESELRALGIDRKVVEGKTIYRAVGCKNCQGNGYFGRLGIFELMEMDSKLRDLTYKVAPMSQIREQARVSGSMVTLKEDGIRKALNGVTTFSEVLRVTSAEEV